MTKILFLGDIFSKFGRLAVKRQLAGIIAREEIDLSLANAENASGGKGLSQDSALELFDYGLDGLTGGNHTFQYSELEPMMDNDGRIVRPANYPTPCPGRGWTVLETPGGVKVGLGNVQGRLFMNSNLDCPFKSCDRILEEIGKTGANISIIDVHAEATSEKKALAWYLDGRLGALFGTHTHVQTSDAQIFPEGLAYISDAGMTGPHRSVIGMNKDESISFFLTGRAKRYKPAKGDIFLEGVIVNFNQKGRAEEIKTLKIKCEEY
ncbi:MAG: YmdB family metallophosphoesterase [Deltaproteobacteria bacterium]|nr:YmdB family metallophosphoesterase [Deltaproteobacteria bacterium]